MSEEILLVHINKLENEIADLKSMGKGQGDHLTSLSEQIAILTILMEVRNKDDIRHSADQEKTSRTLESLQSQIDRVNRRMSVAEGVGAVLIFLAPYVVQRLFG